MTTKGASEGTAETSPDVGSSNTDGSAFDRLLQEVAKAPSLGRVIAPGTRLSAGRFEILRRIGEGGMGVVYEAFDATRKERVALKTMSRLEASDVYRLKNEFRALADVSHPNLVSLHQLCTDDGLWCFTMELVEGDRFDQWVRPMGALDEARLRRALPQLIEGVAAIHVAGKLHRDLKPSNVLVTREGRVVVLDFGLAIDPGTGGVGQTVLDDSVSGTPAYMAPEQAAGQPATSASDFYALGVMVFEALTGRLPFEGKPHEMLVDKQRAEAPQVSRVTPAAPDDLGELCARLLAREPSARLDVVTLRALLPSRNDDSESVRSYGSIGSSGSSGKVASHSNDATPELLGREAEVACLREAFEATLSGQAVILLVNGESGMGKSALCEAFLHELRAQGRATVLSGRCYERENVPFKGFDSLVDDLSRHLRRLPHHEASAVLPREVYALARLFPVLGRVDAVAEAPTKEVPDPLELRRRAYAAFSELLIRSRDRAPLCVHLDDVQWLDSDAVLFMRALMVYPEPAPLLFVLSHRSEDADTNQALLQIRDAMHGNSQLALRTLAVGPLAHEAARKLALRMLPSSADAETAATAVARESVGSPFLVGELCRFVARHGSDASALARLSLRVALGDHLSTLPPLARRLLEHSALAGKPLPAQLLLDATQATHAELDRLRGAHLLRLTRVEGSPIVNCYHDKVREAVADGLSELQRVGCYASLAVALQTEEQPDLELLAACFEGAGQLAAAAEYCTRAADQAMAGTAFLHAAALYEKALDLGSFTPERAHGLRVAQGEALAQAGRGKRAADAFLRAAEEVQGDDRRNLRRRAAEELFNTGHSHEGMALFRELFDEVGLTLPSSKHAALPRLLLSQLRLRLRGLDHVPRRPSAIAPKDLQALELLRASTTGLAMHASPIVAASVIDDYALRALATGASPHVARAIAGMSHFLSYAQPNALERIERMSGLALRIATEVGDPALVGLCEASLGHTLINCGLFRRGLAHERRALEILRSQPNAEQPWIDAAEYYSQHANYSTGNWLEIANTTPNLIEQSYSRDRIWIAVVLSAAGGAAAWLSSDDDAGYEYTLQRAKERWQPSAQAQWPDLILILGATLLHLYRARPEQALALLEQSRAWLMRSLVGSVQSADASVFSVQGRAALAVLRATGNRALASVVRDCAKRLARLTFPVAAPCRSVLDAGLALHSGDVALGARHLREAATGFDNAEYAMDAAAARRRLGELLGGDEGKALRAEGDALMRAQRIVNLEALTEALCPGCRAP